METQQAINYHCHCEERSDVAISSQEYATIRQEIATPVCALVRDDRGYQKPVANILVAQATSLNGGVMTPPYNIVCR